MLHCLGSGLVESREYGSVKQPVSLPCPSQTPGGRSDKVRGIAVSYFLSRGLQRQEAERLTLLFGDLDLVSRAATSGVLNHVKDHKKFIKALTTLTVNPYEKKYFGEDLDDMYIARYKLASCLAARAQELSDDPTVKLPPTADEETRRHDFAAWALWEKAKSKMYISVSQVFGYCYRWGLNPKAMPLHHHPDKKNMVTTWELHDCERTIEAFLAKASTLGLKCGPGACLDSVQNAAIQRTLRSPFSVILGGAGVGKTSTISHLVNEVASHATVTCVAFTHKAKRCIKDKLGNDDVQVSTIHSFIQSSKAVQLSRLFLIIDETSMLDIELLAELASVVLRCDGYQVCFVGDDKQLPPIGRGEFFRQLVTHGTGVSTLSKCYRTERPDMFSAYQAIREGRMPESSDNFKVTYVPDDADAQRSINAKVGALINSGGADNAQFICWQNRDVFKINTWAQERRLKIGRIGPESWKGFYKNDKVIYKGENKEKLTNSMTGQVVEMVQTGGIIVKWEDDTFTRFVKDCSKELYLAYCFTVHSAQGSEYDTVIVPVYDVDKMAKMLDRRFIYTATTRAKNSVVVVATEGIKAYVTKDLSAAPLSDLTIL